MKRHYVLCAAAVTFVPLGLACVDLFHSTNFDTLCSVSPNDPACGAPDGALAPDVVEAAAADAARPHPNFCAWSSAEARTQAQRACAWLGACEHPFGESVFGACVVRAQLAFDCRANPSLRPLGNADAFWACLATVKSCVDVDACIFPAGVQECVAVPNGSSTACGTVAANATTRLECAGPAGRAAGVEPCAILGKTCVREPPEPSSVASCAGALGFNCTKTGCTGTAAVECVPAGTRMLDRGVDCANLGAGKCVEDPDGGEPLCAPAAGAPACTGDAQAKCDGNTASSCVAGNETRIACDALGLVCDVSVPVSANDPSAACVLRGMGACSSADACSGGTVQSCARGALYRVACASVGLGPCKVDANGNAACTPPPR